jgi:uncharacterized protein YggE
MRRTLISAGAAAAVILLAIAIPSIAGHHSSSTPPTSPYPASQPVGQLAVGVPDIVRVLPTTSPPSLTGSADTVSVTGSATISSQPDEAVIYLGVQTQAPTAQAALQENANKMKGVLDALGKLGIKGNDVSTSSLSLYPSYSGGNSISGYQAADQVSATIHDLSVVGKAIDSSVSAGANLAQGISFELSNQNKGVTDALAAAVANAKAKAEALAQAGGASLGPVVSIQEGVSNPGPVPYMTPAMVASANATTPVQPPTIQTQVSVTVVWSLA